MAHSFSEQEDDDVKGYAKKCFSLSFLERKRGRPLRERKKERDLPSRHSSHADAFDIALSTLQTIYNNLLP